MTFYQSVRTGDTIFEKSDKLVSTMSMLGATLVGVGALLAVGANWDFIPSLLKMAIVVLCTLASYAAGWLMKTPEIGKPRIGEALIFLGTMLYGVGIWLVTQVFNYQIELSWGVLLWALGIIPVALVARSGFVAVLACSLLNYWLLMEPYSLVNAGIWAVLSFSLAYAVRSPWALAKGLVGAVIWMADRVHLGAGVIVFYGLMMCSTYLFHANTKSLAAMAKPYLYVGSFFTLLAMLFLTDDRGRMLFYSPTDSLVTYLIQALLVVAVIASSRYWNKIYPEILGCVTLALCVLGLDFVSDTVVHSALAHGLLMMTIIAFVAAASLRLRSTVLLVMSSMYFTVAVSVLYFDTKFSMSDRAFYLVAGGMLMLTFAFAAERALRGKSFNIGQPRQKDFASRSL